MKLVFGVIDQPYNNEAISTGEVAKIIEAKYGLLEAFYNKHGQQVADDLTSGLDKTLESIILGRKVDPADLYLSGTAKVETRLKQFILTGEVETLGIAGVPTKAALKRRSLRFKSKKANKRRPSFVDTGLMESSEKVWVES